MLPKVSCLCPTFARFHLLEEAVYSFLQQDYEGEKELIVCNDFLRQKITFDHPLVKVVNHDVRCPNLGAKRNLTASLATGDLLLTWGDDDIHLPHRINRMVNAIKERKTPIVKEGHFYCIYGGKVYHHTYATAGAHIIERTAFWQCGGIPMKNTGEDVSFNEVVSSYFKLKPLPMAEGDPAFIYRLSGTQRAHISALGEDKPNKKSGYELFLEKAHILVDAGKEPEGHCELKPCWRQDYIGLMKTAIKKT